MSKQVSLTARPRPGTGKGEARALRREGRIPAVAYGAGLDATAVSVDGRELYHALRTEAGLNAIFRLDIEGMDDIHLAIARELQRHPVRRDVLHVDFVTVDRTKPIHVDVPIVLEGHAPGTDEGGVADQNLFTLSVEVLPLEVPDQIVLDVSDMQVGDVKRVEDLDLPQGVTALDDPDRTVISVNVPQLEVPEPVEGEEAEQIADAAEVAAAAEEAPEGEPTDAVVEAEGSGGGE